MKLLLIMMSIFSSTALYAQKFGIGIGGLATPHYMGSAEYYNVTLPFPYFVEDKNVFISDKIIDFSFDLGIGLPVTSEKIDATEPSKFSDKDELIVRSKNYARRGMKDIPWALYGGFKSTINFKPISIEFSIAPGFFLGRGNSHAGTKGKVRIQWHTFLNNSGSNPSCLCFFYEALYASSTYNDNFYGVDRSDEIAGRQEYDADKAGYVGSRTGLYFMKTVSSISFMGYLSVYSMNNSRFRDSPLVQRKTGGTAGLGVAYLF